MEKCPDDIKQCHETLLPVNLGTDYLEWPAGKTNAEIQMFSKASNGKPHNTDSSVTRDHWLVGLVKASASGAEDPGFESRLRRDFPGSSHTSDLKIGTPGLPCQAPDITGSALGVVGPVSAYCDWVR